ncbi:hypothetical protein LENED_005932 [Lentinula edodes]|uniref:Uncharacterized protein n=1 Tax=Lentinula edodes TaxID=5353 RepID=A0A1Q3EAB1_LENED|nr:hypothetical protein LENED_005932 [Lentinula edodes]
MAFKYAFVINPFIVISIGVMLYGFYLALFPTALYHLCRNRGGWSHKFSITALVALFIFATTALVLDIIGSAGAIILTFEDFDGTVVSAAQGKSKALFLNILEELVLMMYSFANVAADAVLLYRLYAVWGFRKRVIIAPLIIAVLNNVLAILDASIRLKIILVVDGPEDQIMSPSDIFWTENATIMTLAFMIVNLVTNTLITGLIAGRIWWISRQISASYGRKGSQNKYMKIVAIILESGVLYPVAILVALLIGELVVPNPSLFALLAEVVAIAPTLIIVRVAMGVNVDIDPSTANNTGSLNSVPMIVGGNEGPKVSALRFASVGGNSGQSTTTTSEYHLSFGEDNMDMKGNASRLV